jgi:hypothetical protein
MKKQARRTLATGITLAIFTLVMVGFAWAGNGPKSGTGPTTDILDGVPTDITGTVKEVGISGLPYQIDTGVEVVDVYGFGPISFWDGLDVDRPIVGEAVAIEAYELTFSDGTSKIIAMSVTIEDEEYPVVLRDPDTGVPLWR